MKKYQVIGGQYQQVNYGESDSLLGAKRIASRHDEYWDNWQGWHTPCVYESVDCYENGYHKPYARPIAYWDSDRKKWINPLLNSVRDDGFSSVEEYRNFIAKG